VRIHQPIVTTEDTENTEGQILVCRSPQGEEDQLLHQSGSGRIRLPPDYQLAAQLRGADRQTVDRH
jgi:hypothetical protein